MAHMTHSVASDGVVLALNIVTSGWQLQQQKIKPATPKTENELIWTMKIDPIGTNGFNRTENTAIWAIWI